MKSSGSKTWKLRLMPPNRSSEAGLGKLRQCSFSGAVDHLALGGDADESRQAEGAAGHVLGEALEAGAVAGGRVDAAVDMEAAVRRGADLDHSASQPTYPACRIGKRIGGLAWPSASMTVVATRRLVYKLFNDRYLYLLLIRHWLCYGFGRWMPQT